jgi:hypothetical protein
LHKINDHLNGIRIQWTYKIIIIYLLIWMILVNNKLYSIFNFKYIIFTFNFLIIFHQLNYNHN